jgi:hypothetical protein
VSDDFSSSGRGTKYLLLHLETLARRHLYGHAPDVSCLTSFHHLHHHHCFILIYALSFTFRTSDIASPHPRTYRQRPALFVSSQKASTTFPTSHHHLKPQQNIQKRAVTLLHPPSATQVPASSPQQKRTTIFSVDVRRSIHQRCAVGRLVGRQTCHATPAGFVTNW